MGEEGSTLYEFVSDIIEDLTTVSSEEQLDPRKMTKLKRTCKKDTTAVKLAFKFILIQLQRKHAEVRYSAFCVLIELFTRSHLFRTLVCDDLDKLFELTVGTNPLKYPLPRPEKAAKKLKVLALTTINDWYKQYGEHYRRLVLGYEFLRDMKKVNFSLIDSTAEEEKRIARDKKEKEDVYANSKLEQVDMQMFDRYEDIMKNLNELEELFQLFFPKLESVSKEQEIENADEDDEIIKADIEDEIKPRIGDEVNKETSDVGLSFEDISVGTETGIQRNYSVTIELSKKNEIEEDEKNTDLLKRMVELHSEVYQQRATVRYWLKSLIKYKSKDAEKMRKLTDLKKMLSSASKKYMELNIIRLPGNKTEGDDDDGFIDVPEKDMVIGQCDKKEGKKKVKKGVKNEVFECVMETEGGSEKAYNPLGLSFAKIKRKTPTQPDTKAAISKERYGRLSRIYNKEKTPKDRLMKKVLNRQAIAKVAKGMNATMIMKKNER